MQGKIATVAPSIPAAVAQTLATTAVVAQTNGASAPAPAAAPADPSSTAEVNAHGVAWNPEYHSTSSSTGSGVLNADGHWKAKRGISTELKARVKMPTGGVPAQVPPAAAAVAPVVAAAVAPVSPVPPVPPAVATPQVEGQNFDEQLDAALEEFDK